MIRMCPFWKAFLQEVTVKSQKSSKKRMKRAVFLMRGTKRSIMTNGSKALMNAAYRLIFIRQEPGKTMKFSPGILLISALQRHFC